MKLICIHLNNPDQIFDDTGDGPGPHLTYLAGVFGCTVVSVSSISAAFGLGCLGWFQTAVDLNNE